MRISFIRAALLLTLISHLASCSQTQNDAVEPSLPEGVSIETLANPAEGKSDWLTSGYSDDKGVYTLGTEANGSTQFPQFHMYRFNLLKGAELNVEAHGSYWGLAILYQKRGTYWRYLTHRYVRPGAGSYSAYFKEFRAKSKGEFALVIGTFWANNWAYKFRVGCADSADTCQEMANKTQIKGWDDEIRVPVLKDINPDPNIVEVRLEAKARTLELFDGLSTEVYTYNGSIPGPTIEAKVGDMLIVHFTNSLPVETTIHWHGVELPADMDGSNIAQKGVAPGSTFRYEFKLLTAATYWYHPHIRVNEQVEKGLHGQLIVRDPQEDKRLQLPTDELLLVLDDMLLDDDGKIKAPFPTDPLKRADTAVNGRFGNHILLNGRKMRTVKVRSGVPFRMRIINVANSRFFRLSIPGTTLYRIGGDSGLLPSPIKTLPVETMEMDMGDMGDMGMTHIVSKPGGGISLVGAERAEVVVTLKGNPGDVLYLEQHDSPRGMHKSFYKEDGTIGFEHDHMDGKAPPQRILRFEIVEGGVAPENVVDYQPPSELRPVVKLVPDAGKMPLMTVFGHGDPDKGGNIMFFATAPTTEMVKDPLTGEMKMKVLEMYPMKKVLADPTLALKAKVGETRVWKLISLTGGDHSFHPHGFFFQHTKTEFQTRKTMMAPWETQDVEVPQIIENKDTIRVPRRRGEKFLARVVMTLIIKFDDAGREGLIEAFGGIPTNALFDGNGITQRGHSGGWIFHCHITEHGDLGMASFLQLTEP